MSRPALPVVAADPGRDAALALCARIGREAGWLAEAWRAVLEEDGFGTLPAAAAPLPAGVAGIALAMLRGAPDDTAAAVERAARAGRVLAESGLGHTAVMRLHFLLREALRRAVHAPDADAAMTWLDPALALAASAALEAAAGEDAVSRPPRPRAAVGGAVMAPSAAA